MNCTGQAVLVLMEKEYKNQPEDAVSNKAFDMSANSSALLKLFKAASEQTTTTRKKLAREAFPFITGISDDCILS